jgi:ribosome-associated protein
VKAIATQTQHAPEATEISGQHSHQFSEQLPKRLSELAVKSLDDDKAEDIVVIDLAGKTSIADYMVVASGRSSRQVGAMAEHLREKLKVAGAPAVEIEGMAQADWVLIDAGDVIVNVFRPEVRAFYDLEKMWAGATRGRKLS